MDAYGFISSCGACITVRSSFMPRAARGTSRRPRSMSVGRTQRISITCKKSIDPREHLDESGLAEWGRVRGMLLALNPALGPKDADKIVARAFGWGSQKWWRGDVEKEVPCAEQVESVLEFLRSEMGFDDETIGQRIVKKFPEVIRMPIERMRGNMEYIQKSFPALKGNMLRNSIREQPAALGFDVDCGGDCMSECSRCWVRFE